MSCWASSRCLVTQSWVLHTCHSFCHPLPSLPGCQLRKTFGRVPCHAIAHCRMLICIISFRRVAVRALAWALPDLRYHPGVQGRGMRACVNIAMHSWCRAARHCNKQAGDHSAPAALRQDVECGRPALLSSYTCHRALHALTVDKRFKLMPGRLNAHDLMLLIASSREFTAVDCNRRRYNISRRAFQV